MSSLTRFTWFYFAGGALLLAATALLADVATARFLALNWMAVGIALALISYGMPRKAKSDVAGAIYLVGIGWLVLLLIAGIFLLFNDGIGVAELDWLSE